MNKLTILDLEYNIDSSLYFERFIDLPHACFLDSCLNSGLDSCAPILNGSNGRFDIITADPSMMVTVSHDGITTVENRMTATEEKISDKSPFAVLSELLTSMTPIHNKELPFTGGTLGYWGYELCELLEPENIERRNNNTPLMSVGLYHWALINDHKLERCQMVFHPDISRTIKDRVLDNLDCGKNNLARFSLKEHFRSTQKQADYNNAFQKIQNYITAGDCYEVNLTQEFTAPFSGDSWQAYKHLRKISPAPYSAYLTTQEFQILSHSPERFIKVSDRKVETHPIKGTRPRGATAEQDNAQAEALLSSAKDKAENLMIVDLLRNDLGKVCETGSIQVPRLFSLESYANVHHLVSTVTGILPEKTDVYELFSSAFPGGSITGAPKIRSMEIIRELEPVARSVYCGALGYASCNGELDTSITIRTMLAKDQMLHCWGGGAIVSDSDCEQEYYESITKVSNLMTALENDFFIDSETA